MMRLLGLLAVCFAARLAPAQDQAGLRQPVQLAVAGPRFLSVPTADAPAVDVSAAPALQRRVTLELDRVPLKAALDAVARQADLHFVTSRETVPLDRPVTVHADGLTVAAALTELLLGAGLDVQLAPNGVATLVSKTAAVLPRAFRRQQVGRIEGRVTNVRTTEPVANAVVVIEGTNYRATTKNAGQYAIIDVPPGAYNVTARLLGYTPVSKRIEVGAEAVAHADFALAEAAAALEQVVTTAVGDQRRVELGNSIATIKADSLARTAPITQISDVLSGRAPGVEVLESDGQVGAGPRIRIRGLSSFTLSNDPIVYVDGVRLDAAGGGSFNGASPASYLTFPTPSRLNDIDPADIASIDILKGPSAATEYGTDAANGVIVIKTKHGRSGGPQWDIHAEQGTSNVPSSAHFEVPWYGWGHTTDGSDTPVECPRTFGTGPTVANGGCALDSVTKYQPLDHSATTVFGTGTTSRLGAQLSGGGDRLQYFLSGGYDNAVGVMQLPPYERQQLEAQGRIVPGYELRPNAMDQANIRGRVFASVGSTTDLGFSAGYVSNHQRAGQDLTIYGAVLGPGYRDSAYGGWGNGGYYAPQNVFALAGSEGIRRFSGSTNGTWRPASWLSTRGTVGLDLGNRTDDSFQPAGPDPNGTTAFPGSTGTGYHAIGSASTTLYTVDIGATATAALTVDLSSKTSAGFQYNITNRTGTLAQAYGLTANGSLNGASVYVSHQLDSAARTVGSYVEESVGWRDLLFLTGAVRVDAGSGFGSQVNSAVYPKVSLSWAALQTPSQRLRLRAAYGESGVQPPSGATLSLYTPTTVGVGGVPVTGDTATTVGNTRLKPERSAELETGFDAGLWGDRVTLELTYYNKLSHNTIVGSVLPGSGGGSIEYENLGSVRNYGLEGTVTLQVLASRPIGWDVTVGGSVNQNRLASLAPGQPPIRAPYFPYILQYQQVVGYPVFGFWAPRLQYVDANHDGIIEPSEVSDASAPSYAGSSVPTREVTLSSGVSLFRNAVRIGAQVDYRGGFRIQNSLLSQMEDGPTAPAFNDPHAPLADQARAVEQSQTLVPMSTAYFGDGSFVRWREVSVTYTLPAHLNRALHVRTSSLTLLGRNLALWTRYSGADPEVVSIGNTGGAPPDGVSDIGAMPLVRSWGVRANVGL